MMTPEEYEKKIREIFATPETYAAWRKSPVHFSADHLFRQLAGQGWKQCNYTMLYFPPELIRACKVGNATYNCVAAGTLLDPFTRQWFNPDTTETWPVWHENKLILVPSSSAMNVPGMGKYPVSKYFHVYCANKLPFHEHSGAGFGQPKKYNVPHPDSLGIEIECVINTDPNDNDPWVGARQKLDLAALLQKKYPKWVCERDGSLENGVTGAGLLHLQNNCLELVSPPDVFDNLVGVLNEMVPLLRDKGVVGNTIGDYFAIHVTANVPDVKTRVKMLRTVYNKKLRTFWKRVSYRAFNKGFKIDQNPGENSKAYCALWDFDDHPDEVMVQACSENHYRAAYVRNSGAVELRIFQTRVKLDYIINVLEITKLLRDFAKSSDTDFVEFLKRNASESLLKYFKSTNAFVTTRFDK